MQMIGDNPWLAWVGLAGAVAAVAPEALPAAGRLLLRFAPRLAARFGITAAAGTAASQSPAGQRTIETIEENAGQLETELSTVAQRTAPQVQGAGSEVARLKSDLFLKFENLLTPAQRSVEALARFRQGTLKIPEGLTRANLLNYRTQAEQAIERARVVGPEALQRAEAVQRPRIQLIEEIVKSGKLKE